MADRQTLFGCAGFESVPLVCGELQGAEKENTALRVGKMRELFNFVTLPFYWGRFEPEEGRPDTERLLAAARWWRGQGVAVKGHPLCWHTSCAPWLLGYSDGDILQRQLERVRREVSAFAGVIDMWDVINEAVIMPVFDKYDNAVTRICKREGRVSLIKQLFAAAREANPGAVLLINDFDMSEDYARLLEDILNAGVRPDAIGLQSHMHQGYWGAEKTAEVLERFGRFGLPLHFTEVNLVSGRLMPAHIIDLNDYVTDDWPTTHEGEERQAAEAAAFYKQLLACPLVEAVTWWNFTDGHWLRAPAGLVTASGREKPAFAALRELINP
jgi:GH35 family endo-1,4-beta-xylanase